MKFVQESKELIPLILTKRWNHHTKSGGYDKLAEYLSEDRIITAESGLVRSSIRYTLWKNLVTSISYANQYEPVDLFTELKALKRVFYNNYKIVHALYAEDQLNFLLKFKKYLDCKLIGSFHLPSESIYVQKAISLGHYENLKKLDAAIVVSQSMVKMIGEWVGYDNVHVVPHGIDINIFQPGYSGKKSEYIHFLSVGHHGRDWDVILDVLRFLQAESEKYVYNVVVPKSMSGKFEGLRNTHIHNNIPESALIKLYQNADVLLLPLRFGTANNSILESLACGTPVISTKVGGIPEYVDEETGWLFDIGDAHGIAEILLAMLNDQTVYLSKRKAARSKAELYDWSSIAAAIREIYAITQKKNIS